MEEEFQKEKEIAHLVAGELATFYTKSCGIL
jgi:hypothetical protein